MDHTCVPVIVTSSQTLCGYHCRFYEAQWDTEVSAVGLQWPLNEPGAIEARRSLFFEQSRCETQTSRFWNKYRIEAVRLTVYYRGSGGRVGFERWDGCTQRRWSFEPLKKTLSSLHTLQL